eukprot:6194368-Pleurochrysis_carterae.AAC.2
MGVLISRHQNALTFQDTSNPIMPQLNRAGKTPQFVPDKRPILAASSDGEAWNILMRRDRKELNAASCQILVVFAASTVHAWPPCFASAAHSEAGITLLPPCVCMCRPCSRHLAIGGGSMAECLFALASATQHACVALRAAAARRRRAVLVCRVAALHARSIG